MSRAKIEALANEHHGRFYDYDDDGVLLLDKTGNRILHLEKALSNNSCRSSVET
jgi:hypothetical protein